ADARFGVPTTASGERCHLAVVGMGKLGGRELNAGSDVDLILFYETDEGRVGTDARTLHEYFTRVAQRFVATLDESTEDGVVWRVDLRLRPEGTRGALVNALPAAERYYETWGRTWERAALVRARIVAGDAAFGGRLLDTLAPFVWRHAVDPQIADEMAAMLARSRVESVRDVDRDLKIGPGGIREVEFFAQTLQLVWGGREPRVRTTNTIEALRRLRARGLVTEREERDLADAYLLLRRLEHRIQFATGQQTHALPAGPMLHRIARSLGYADGASLAADLSAVRAVVSRRFSALRPGAPSPIDATLGPLWAALDAQDEGATSAAAARPFGTLAGTDLPRHLLALARRPDGPLGAATRDREPSLGPRLIEALADAADPEQAARLLVAFFSRFATPWVYVRALAADPQLVRALCSLLGASAFLGETLAAHPDLVDRVLFVRGATDAAAARAQLDEEVNAVDPLDLDGFVGALRRAKRRVTFEVGLADLAGELATRDVSLSLTALADATLRQACIFAMRERASLAEAGAAEPPDAEEVRGLALVAMCKLGGREIGYGSDLDLIFVYEHGDDVSAENFARTAQRVLRLAGASHDEGPGYELDTRLRPSGSQGLLVVSLDGFARYQEERAESWERQALIKARACAGDSRLGERVVAIAHRAAYERGAPDPESVLRLRARMERELGHERLDRPPARYDLKVGRGGIVDVEFAVQWLQMRHGLDPRVRSTETEAALAALEAAGYLERSLAEALREGWRFLRRLEQRLRIAHGTSASLIEEGAPGLSSLARRMGMRDGPRASAEEALLVRYVAVTREVRAAYANVLGANSARSSEATERTKDTP
ncbi:MAG TPA: bifunctional [glutamate--ammonia ligase]-adenylyl-L-tyrosine phosphorylase/[glutamate--ammonia-ligase] adenylyltransferase, partial [Polyangiaceae bacterium]|nr:bifunctional [glutamate--ammonia ligase]-adenylyl-L-tyrosine phosphorylase/[glutamate--ammonia-ligase] adenylyltransferase [Polyangiaceae bacterium]